MNLIKLVFDLDIYNIHKINPVLMSSDYFYITLSQKNNF
ncbi:hypothetical protein J533_0377 [Acinetobacter baumannii 4749]|nr:hypothetical protein J533_0377 [Acinetobacter baumannii 4749]